MYKHQWLWLNFRNVSKLSIKEFFKPLHETVIIKTDLHSIIAEIYFSFYTKNVENCW